MINTALLLDRSSRPKIFPRYFTISASLELSAGMAAIYGRPDDDDVFVADWEDRRKPKLLPVVTKAEACTNPTTSNTNNATQWKP